MIDYELQPMVKSAVARLDTGTKVGTGYLVEKNRIATCHHVVADLQDGAPVTCMFGDLREKRTAYVLVRDKASDAALLDLRDAISAEPLDLADSLERDFWVHGFPNFTDGTSISIEGRLADRDTVDQNGTRCFAMYSQEFGGRGPDSIGGFSGSPVLVGRRVIGHMSSVLGSIQARKAPNLGYAFAVRSAGVARLLGRPAAAAPALDPDAAKAAVDRTISITQVFEEIDASTTAAEIEAALKRGTEVVDETRLLAAERLIGFGAPAEALERLAEAQQSTRRDELKALALSLRGDHAQAVGLLNTLPGSAESDGILGGAFKRRWVQTRVATWLRSAHEAYSAAYAFENAPYPGINVAACKLWLGRKDESQQLASVIAKQLEVGRRNAWDEASLAEAYLLSGRFDEARAQYAVAVDKQATQPRSLAVMRRQVRLELPALGRPAGSFDDLFPVPRIAVFTGHRVDDDETRGRFPPSKVAEVKRRLADTLAERDIRSGYSSAASGGDIFFIKALLDRGGEPHVFLPFPAADFIETSVGPLWQGEFEEIMALLGSRVVVLDVKRPDDTAAAYRKCNDAMRTAAVQEAKLLDEDPLLVAVLSAQAEAKTGGSADMVAAWQQAGLGEPIRIDPSA